MIVNDVARNRKIAPIMVRYLTMIGKPVRLEVYPPSAAPASQRLVKGDQGIEG